MWTSSYLPGRRALALAGSLVAAVVLLFALGLHVRRCSLGAGAPHGAAAGPEGIPVRLYIAGTPGACVRLDGQVVGPIPAQVELFVRGPQRVFLQACKRGYLDFTSELELRPGEDRTEQVLLPRYHLIHGGGSPAYPYGRPHASLRCPCQD